MSIKIGTIIEDKIETLAFGGDGIMRHQGQVIFTPFALPGDKSRIKITHSKKTFARAKLLHVVTPSKDRIEALCPAFSQCGGCQMQNTTYENQLIIKHQFVKDALTRIGGLKELEVKPTLGTKEQWHYRRHIRLHFLGSRVGYFDQDNKIIEITQCPIFSSDMQSILKEIKSLCVKIQKLNPNAAGDISLFKAADNKYVLGFTMPIYFFEVVKFLKTLMDNQTYWQGVWWNINEKLTETGNCNMEFEIDGLKIGYGPTAFVQAHPQQSAKLYLDLTNDIVATKPNKVLDLYSGIGVTSVLLKNRGLDVVGVEGSLKAVELAEKNQMNNNLGDITWHVGNIDDVLPEILDSVKADVVIVNPPRTGLNPPVKEALLKHAPKNIFYISCMPATLARDLATLCAQGYHVDKCQPYDLFPQTTHVETYLKLTKI